jgi:hypothetical protein
MKRKIGLILGMALLLVSTTTLYAQRCGSNMNLNSIKRNDPSGYLGYLQIENFTKDYINKVKSGHDHPPYW